MKHDIASVEHRGEFSYVAVCECEHLSEGPNPDTARKRHGIHQKIQDARAALDHAKEADA